ncbi:MAG: hypothetical protein KTR31_29810 [Myxococcales bacterium]|nr:hypothetical protein [Myxococcales bacterium]
MKRTVDLDEVCSLLARPDTVLVQALPVRHCATDVAPFVDGKAALALEVSGGR